MKQLSMMWQRMTEAQKERYKHMSELDRARFESQRRRYRECGESKSVCLCKRFDEVNEKKLINGALVNGKLATRNAFACC